MLSAAATVECFFRRRGALLKGVIVPAIGAVALLGVIAATVVFETRVLQYYAWGGVALGIPFALWRGWKTRGGLRAVS